MDRKKGLVSHLRVKSEFARETLAECLGTFVLVVVGGATNAFVTLNKESGIAHTVVPWGWGIALALGVSIAGGASGGHVNPAVTLGMASVGKLPIKKVFHYILGQLAGAFLAAVVVFFVYRDALDKLDNGIRDVNTTAGIFSCFPKTFVSSNTCLLDQIVSTGLFVMSINAITDEKNMNVAKGLVPFMIGLLLTGLIFGFGFNCGAPINPARDLGPRIFTAMAGWGSEVFSFRNYNWFWVPIVGPCIGGIVGAWLYMLFIELHLPVDSYDITPPSSPSQNEFLPTAYTSGRLWSNGNVTKEKPQEKIYN